MIKRLALSDHARHQAQWPDEVPRDGQLFAPRRPLRQMVVMIDAELDVLTAEAQRSPDGLDQVSLLSGLLTNSLIRRYRFAEDGPPPSVQPEIRAGVEVYPGWVVLTRDAPEGVHGVVFTDGPNSNSRSGVMGNACEIAANDVKTDAYADLPPGIARSRRQADALAAQVAIQGVGADIYVTEREFLHRRGGYVTSGVTVCSPAEALPLVSLYLRIQGEFRVRDDHTFNRGLFYWVGTREILPAAWRWITACHQHSTHSGQEPIFLLAGSLLQRVDRALEARDRLHAILNRAQDNDLREDALAHLDVILISFMAAFDVAARVAHRVLQVGGDEYLAGWQKRRSGGWWDRVRAVDPALADAVAAGSDGDHILTIARLLRNSVHGAALQGVGFGRRRGPQETLVGLPERDQSALLVAMQAVGGQDSWGVRPIIPGRVYVDPGVIVERLFETVVPLLNQLMNLTPVERLAGVALAPEQLVPPVGVNGRWFQPWMRNSVRWQLGL
jgi:hypothetical protein